MTVPLEVVTACLGSAAFPAMACRTWRGVAFSTLGGAVVGLIVWSLIG